MQKQKLLSLIRRREEILEKRIFKKKDREEWRKVEREMDTVRAPLGNHDTKCQNRPMTLKVSNVDPKTLPNV